MPPPSKLPNEPPSAGQDTPADLTTILQLWRDGNDQAFNTLVERVYTDLKALAASRLQRLDRNCTLSATDLLHETLIGIMPTGMAFKNRVHFFATMSLAIRAVLVDHARARAAQKRGGDLLRINLTNAELGEDSQALDLIAIDEALAKLEALDPRAGHVLHLTHFAGLTHAEVAEVLGISVPSVTRDLRFARSWVMEAIGALDAHKHGAPRFDPEAT